MPIKFTWQVSVVKDIDNFGEYLQKSIDRDFDKFGGELYAVACPDAGQATVIGFGPESREQADVIARALNAHYEKKGTNPTVHNLPEGV